MMYQHRHSHVLLIFILLFGSASCVGSRNMQDIKADVQICSENLNQDIDFLFKQLETVHPNVCAYISEKRYTEIKNYLRKQCKYALSLNQFYKKVRIALDNLEEGHTFVHSPLAKTPGKQKQAMEAQLNKLLATKSINQSSYKLLTNPKVCVLKYNYCGLPQERSRYETFFEEMFNEIRKNNTQVLIIDVRNNGGGFSGTNNSLTRYFAGEPFRQYERMSKRLTPPAITFYRKIGIDFISLLHETYDTTSLSFDPNGMPTQKDFTVQAKFVHPIEKPLRFTGRIFVLIGRGTYSSAMLFASTVKHCKFATLIGEETLRFDKQHYGDVVFISLPHSQLTIQVSTAIFTSMQSDNRPGDGITPDYKVIQKKRDRKKGIDTVEAYVLNLVNKQEAPEILR